MSSLDDFMDSLRKLGSKISREGRRTADMARLKMDLKNLDVQRREVLTRLGTKVYDLNRRDVIRDEGINEQCVEQFDELDDLEMKIQKILEEIQRISLQQNENESQSKTDIESGDMQNDEPESTEKIDLENP